MLLSTKKIEHIIQLTSDNPLCGYKDLKKITDKNLFNWKI